VLAAGAALGLIALASVARGQSTAEAQAATKGLPSLDSMLGLEAPGTKPAPVGPGGLELRDVVRQRLDRLLEADRSEEDDFTKAVALMEQSSERLGGPAGEALTLGDVGESTQRLQEEAVRKLDLLIAKARKKNQSQCDSQCQDGSQGKQEQQQQAQPQQAQASQQEQRASGREQAQAQLPAARSPELRPSLEQARAAWGNLPERVRASLLQGAGDRFSREYQRLTEQYYQRLGEQAE
jgi:hypothetical protein